MTINGGKPHAVGDRGQRYEVTFFNPATFKRQVLGWSETREGAESMVAGVNTHPTWAQPQIEDRRIESAPVCPWCDRQGHDGCQHADEVKTCQHHK